MKKLILFIHGLGGNENTWGDFPKIIAEDNDLKNFDIKIYTYPTSLIRPKSIIKPFSSMLSFLIPQTKLPLIQDLAKGLKTEINNRYKEYDSICIVAHSMGGLIAKKYILDELSLKNTIKVDKLLLYAVPNHGSNLAELSKLYNHEQIKQLSKDSDFIESLNTDISKLNIHQHISIKYVIGSQDSVVDKRSAQNEYGANYEMIHCGHMDIVKPKSDNDLSYKIFKNYVLEEKTFKNNKPQLTDESIEYIFKSLLSEIKTISKNQLNTDTKLTKIIQEIKG